MNIILGELNNSKDFLFVRTDYKKSRPQLKILINKKRAYDLEVSNSEIGRTLEILLAGRKINSFIDKGEEYYVILQAKKEFRKKLENILSYEVKNKNGDLVRLENVLNIEETAEAKELNRYNKMRSITLSAGLNKNYSLGEGIDYLENLSKNKLKGNYKIDFRGQSKEFKESSNQFYFLFIISLLFVYLILCAQFESFRYPFIIMISVPLTLLIPIICLIIFENSLNIFSQIGIIILMGIAAKNGILIVEFARQLKNQGENSSRSIIESCKKRFRPVVMTGISTIVGVIPLVIGSGAGYESRLTIGIVLISGIFFSIFLTLFITPFFYSLIDKEVNES
jgi:multidrug efflux pump